ncbi:MAG: 50S ribosomal protein L16 3-hydroxylase [Francisellaceae bacterium]|jgi:50S ribosomal protein L16 3-hydroxylase
MLKLNELSHQEFLKNYWQKKPLLIKQGISNFSNPIEPDKLAGLSLENEFESRLVIGHVADKKNWQLKTGPFTSDFFSQLPEENWTLLVNGVDRLIPEVNEILNQFNFLPQWRVDDVMISYAAKGGSVGPHFDVYDVFLLQGKGQRKWTLTSKNCNEDNYQKNMPLRLMKVFEVEEEFILNEGDILYIPPYVGHHGVALTEDCMTYSIGYRGYSDRELLESFGDFTAENEINSYYKDPDWSELKGTGEVTQASIEQARKSLKKLIDKPELFKCWFGNFVTEMDQQAESLFLPLEADAILSHKSFRGELELDDSIERNPLCRFAYIENNNFDFMLFINGKLQEIEDINQDLIKYICNHRLLNNTIILELILSLKDSWFLHRLYKENFIVLKEN